MRKRSGPQGTDGASTSVADSGFCEELAEYLGIKSSTAKTALLYARNFRERFLLSTLAKPGFAPPRPARTAVPGYPGTGAGLNKSRDDRHQSRGARDGGRDTLRHGRRAVTTRGMVFLEAIS